MFRLVADITELNIDQVKLPKIPGLGMLMKLSDKQKISMIVSVLNSQKGQFLPKWQEEVNQKWGQLQLLDYQVEQPGDGSCLVRIRIDVGNADYDKAIDSVIPHVFQEKTQTSNPKYRSLGSRTVFKVSCNCFLFHA